MSFFPRSELRGRHISDSTLTACANGRSYHSLLNIFSKNPRAVGWSKAIRVPKKS